MKYPDFALSGVALRWWVDGMPTENFGNRRLRLDLAILRQSVEDRENRGLPHIVENNMPKKAEDTVTVVMLGFNREPHFADIGVDLDSWQSMIGGFIEIIKLPIDGLFLICNEDGMRLNLPYNRKILGVSVLGPAFVARFEEGKEVDVLFDDLEAVKKICGRAV